jgi:hypothetical protein
MATVRPQVELLATGAAGGIGLWVEGTPRITPAEIAEAVRGAVLHSPPSADDLRRGAGTSKNLQSRAREGVGHQTGRIFPKCAHPLHVASMPVRNATAARASSRTVLDWGHILPPIQHGCAGCLPATARGPLGDSAKTAKHRRSFGHDGPALATRTHP